MLKLLSLKIKYSNFIKLPFILIIGLLIGCVNQKQLNDSQTKQSGQTQLKVEDIARDEFGGTVLNASPTQFLDRQRTQKNIQSVYGCVQKQEGFAGLVIKALDNYEVLTFFKGEAAIQLENCTNDPLFKPIQTSLSLIDLEDEKVVATSALNQKNIENYAWVEPYGHSANKKMPHLAPNFISTDGHVVVAVHKKDLVGAADAINSLNLKSVYIRDNDLYNNDTVLTGR